MYDRSTRGRVHIARDVRRVFGFDYALKRDKTVLLRLLTILASSSQQIRLVASLAFSEESY